MTPTVILDNGASTIKAGISDGGPALLVPNAIARNKSTTYFGHELLRCTDHASLTYRLPLDKVRSPKDALLTSVKRASS